MQKKLICLIVGLLHPSTQAIDLSQEITEEDCIEPGTHNWPDDLFFNSPEYQKQDASEKLEQLWDIVNIEKKPQCQPYGGSAGHFSQVPMQTLKKVGDEMPLSACRNIRREKFLHAQGVVGKAVFESYTDKHTYTGIFKGASNVLIRFSETGLFHDELRSGANPSVALKFLRDKVHSANQFGMVSFESTSTWDFFANDLVSILPEFTGNCGPSSIAKYNAQATPFLFETGSYDMARYEENGDEVSEPNYPFMLRFKPNREKLPVTPEGRFYEYLRGEEGIPKDIVLFEVYAVEKPTDYSNPANDQGDLIGVIKTTSEFTTSLWGDEMLFFQHGDFQEDIDNKFEECKKAENQTLTFDFDEFGRWPRAFTVPEVDDEVMIDRWEEMQCPFQWVIDALNGTKFNSEQDSLAQLSVELC